MTVNCYNMRLANLYNYHDSLPCNSDKAVQLQQTIQKEIAIDCMHNTEKALELLRLIVQESFTKEVGIIIDKYMNDFFIPAVCNARNNRVPVDDGALDRIKCNMLDGVRRQFEQRQPGASTSVPLPRTHIKRVRTFARPSSALTTNHVTDLPANDPLLNHRDSDNDSDISALSSASRKRNARFLSPVRTPPVRTFTPSVGDDIEFQSDVASICDSTKFILGSHANKILGWGNARGRMYNKHPRIFKYECDNADKNHMAATRGQKAAGRMYIVLAEDIEAILRAGGTDDQRCRSPSTAATLLRNYTFTLPPNVLDKIRASMSRKL